MQSYKKIGVVSTCIIFLFNCSAPEPKKVSSTKDQVPPPKECQVKAEETDDEIDAGDDASLWLMQEVTYEKDIKPIVVASCAVAGCHVAGTATVDLSTFALNVDYAEDSLARINANGMPIGNPLEQEQKDLWAAWLDGGTVEGDVTEETPEGDDEPAEEEAAPEGDETQVEETDAAADCDVEDTEPKPTSNSDLLNMEAVEACHDEGVIYDRNAKECGTATIDISYECDEEGITTVFKAEGLNPTPVLERSLGKAGDTADLGEGYEIDQCGETATGLPIVILVKVLEPPETPGLKVRVIAVE